MPRLLAITAQIRSPRKHHALPPHLARHRRRRAARLRAAARRRFAAYPDKPIRLIVPFAAGGNADFVARLSGEYMSQALGQPIVVEYRTGAGGSLGADMAAKSAPDGYTLFTGSNGPLTVNPFVQAKLGYDPLKDFIAVGLANLAPHCLAVNAAVQAKTLQEAIALSKTSPFNVGTSGAGSASHMTLARFNAATGANIAHVPYRGGGAIVPDLLSGTLTGAMTEFPPCCSIRRRKGAHPRRRVEQALAASCPTCRR